MSTTTQPTPNIPLPAGATSCGGWDTINPDSTLVRGLEWSHRDAGNIGVCIDGWQDTTGAFTRGISVYGVIESESITAVQARAVAAVLIAAADELDGLATR